MHLPFPRAWVTVQCRGRSKLFGIIDPGSNSDLPHSHPMTLEEGWQQMHEGVALMIMCCEPHRPGVNPRKGHREELLWPNCTGTVRWDRPLASAQIPFSSAMAMAISGLMKALHQRQIHTLGSKASTSSATILLT